MSTTIRQSLLQWADDVTLALIALGFCNHATVLLLKIRAGVACEREIPPAGQSGDDLGLAGAILDPRPDEFRASGPVVQQV
jgi:hypothetical protein